MLYKPLATKPCSHSSDITILLASTLHTTKDDGDKRNAISMINRISGPFVFYPRHNALPAVQKQQHQLSNANHDTDSQGDHRMSKTSHGDVSATAAGGTESVDVAKQPDRDGDHGTAAADSDSMVV
jgi:hypothetical protein